MKKFLAYTSLLLAVFIALFTFLVMKPIRKNTTLSVSSVYLDSEVKALWNEYFPSTEPGVCAYVGDFTGTLHKSATLEEAVSKFKDFSVSTVYTKPQVTENESIIYKVLSRDLSNNSHQVMEITEPQEFDITLKLLFDPAGILKKYIPPSIQVYDYFCVTQYFSIYAYYNYTYATTSYGDYIFEEIWISNSTTDFTLRRVRTSLYRAEDFFELCKDVRGPQTKNAAIWTLLWPNYNIEDPSFNIFTKTPNQRRLWTVLYCAVSYLTLSVSAWIGLSIHNRKRAARKAAPKTIEINQ